MFPSLCASIRFQALKLFERISLFSFEPIYLGSLTLSQRPAFQAACEPLEITPPETSKKGAILNAQATLFKSRPATEFLRARTKITKFTRPFFSQSKQLAFEPKET
jgi:hypothetical protein